MDLLWNRAEQPVALLVLAHGAGAPMDSDFMNAMAEAMADQGISVVRFEFPYMARRRQEQRKFPPNRAPQLLAHFRDVLAALPDDNLPIWIGGKSMGGRMASLLAAQADCPPIHGVVALGYPFHPPGKPEKTRTEHLPHLAVPMLICQGERDPFGKPQEVTNY
ncbi:MAG: putative alpha/beta-hydrolase family hydrolase, partial [Alcanivorax sp.]